MQRRSDYSTKLHEQACRVIPGGVNSSLRHTLPPLVIKRADGATLRDADDNEYLDFHGAFGPALLGHNHPGVRRRVIEALQGGVLPGVGSTELEIQVARIIHQHVPSAEKVLLCNTGSEATFHALRVARAMTGRKKIIKFQGCYHGIHDYVLRNVASPLGRLGHVDPGSAGILSEALENTLVCDFNHLDQVESALQQHRGQVAAIILEPIAHNVGCILPRAGFLEGLRQLCSAHGVILVFDEVITGFRHHVGGYQKISGVTPDLTTLGKAIANGFTLAAVCGKAEVMDHFNTRPGGDTFYGGTFNGNAVGCAAALATIEVLEREHVHDYLFRMGTRVRQGLTEIHQRLGIPATVAGFGSVFITYFMEGPIDSYTDLLRNDAQRFIAYRRGLMERRIFQMPANLKRCHLSFAHTEAHIDHLLETSEDVLKQMKS
jgi:glutamate-1-semialdehyde 2,1-aminomutase